MGQPTPLLLPPSGLDLAILAPRSPASRRAKGARKSASGRSVSTARSTATRRAVSDTLRMRDSFEVAWRDSAGEMFLSGSCIRRPSCKASCGNFWFEPPDGGNCIPVVPVHVELMWGNSARGRSRGTCRCSEKQIREELAEAAPGNLKLQIASGPVQPTEINQQRNLRPRFRSFRSKTNIAQHAGKMR